MGYPILLLNFLGSAIPNAEGMGEKREGAREREREGREGRRERLQVRQTVVGFGPRQIWLTILTAPLIFTRCVTQSIFLNFETQ